jgi:hypothetical protein
MWLYHALSGGTRRPGHSFLSDAARAFRAHPLRHGVLVFAWVRSRLQDCVRVNRFRESPPNCFAETLTGRAVAQAGTADVNAAENDSFYSEWHAAAWKPRGISGQD